MPDARPPVTADLQWTGDLVFSATSAKIGLVIDGNSTAGSSPVQLLAIGLAGCMAMDVLDIVRKSRQSVSAFRCLLTGDRAPDHPRRLLKVRLHFHLKGDVPPRIVGRAISLSRDRYCSVWHSMRQDIELSTAFDVEP